MIEISGNTYPLRKILVDLDGKWDKQNRCWRMSDNVEETVTRLAQKFNCAISIRFVPNEEKGE